MRFIFRKDNKQQRGNENKNIPKNVMYVIFLCIFVVQNDD